MDKKKTISRDMMAVVPDPSCLQGQEQQLEQE